MTSHRIIFGIFILLNLNCLSQGWQLLPAPTSASFTSVFFTDAYTGYVAGNYGTIMKTTDGGMSWVNKSSGTIACLYDIKFTNQNTGYIVGDSGILLKTVNSGNTWVRVYSSTNHPLVSICFPSANLGYAAGAWDAIILKTTNAGTTWTIDYADYNWYLNSLCFPDTATGYAVGYDGFVYKKNHNSGWHYLNNAPDPAHNVLNSVCFIDSLNGLTCNDFHVYHTTDGGGTWSLTDYAHWFNRVYYFNENVGYSIGENSVIRKTIDGGQTWINQDYNTPYNLMGVHFPTLDTGYVVGAYGSILKTINGGVGIKMNNPDSAIKVYPNPINQYFSIDMGNQHPSEVIKLQIFNELGQVIFKINYLPKSKINVSSINPGIYFLQLKTDNQFFMTKILKY